LLKDDIRRAAALSLFVVLIVCAVTGRWRASDWETPVLGGDALSFLAYMKAARDGYVVPVAQTFVPDLNAPFTANWNDYPRPQKAFFWLAGRIARVIGLFPAVHLLLVFAHVAAAVAFYAVARRLRCRPAWAAAGAVAFSCSNYIWQRNIGHLALSLYWHIPLATLVVGWCFRRRGLLLRDRYVLPSFVVAVVTAFFNVYYAAMFAQLLLLAGAAQLVRRSWRKAIVPALLAATVVGVFMLESLGTLLYPRTHGVNTNAVVRFYSDLVTYSLRPVELVLPPPDGNPLHLGGLLPLYWSTSASGENRPVYIGLVALAGLGLLLGRPLLAFLRGRRVFIPPALGVVGWIVAFSIPGGVDGGVLGGLGIALLRGANRYSIWIVAVVLLHLVGYLSRAPWTRTRRRTLAAGFALLALLDQVPPLTGPMGTWSVRKGEREYAQMAAAFAHRLEASLPEGSMVFMLPVQEFPEGGKVFLMGDYSHFVPYVFTSHLRYSYGTDKGRRREEWQRTVEAMPPERMVERLERYGFAGIVLDKHGYDDSVEDLLQGFAAAGRPVAFAEGGGSRVFIPLHPSTEPASPELAPSYDEGWRGLPNARARWAKRRSAALTIDNPDPKPRRVTLSFELTAVRPRTVWLSVAGQKVGTWTVISTESVRDLPVTLAVGESALVFETDRDSDQIEMAHRPRIVTFGVQDLEVRTIAEGSP
jgi:hypothetical protein